jgi:S-adenosylmethionine-diacylgycerolhomoserine-N-methlytransferase
VTVSETGHAALMDSVYRGQRHIYDLTRRYYLFGRDRLIDELACRAGDSVLEVGCGTGRNLARIVKRWSGAVPHGLDISAEMLKSARAKLGERARLARADATAFTAREVFGIDGFDRVVFPYALSMIPDWQAALAAAADAVAPGGSLHVVDFGDCSGLPGPARGALVAWLAKFHVTRRLDLPEAARRIAAERGMRCDVTRGPLGYYQLVRLFRD